MTKEIKERGVKDKSRASKENELSRVGKKGFRWNTRNLSTFICKRKKLEMQKTRSFMM